jgi:TldD protein
LHEERVHVGNDQATIMNNPAVYSMEDAEAGSNGSYYFDHEGQLARAQTILDSGYLSTPMTDLSSAFKLKVNRTANGKRESWRRPLMTRQTNTYFTPGDYSVDALIGMVKNGFLAVHPHGGMEDPKGGSLTAGSPYFEEIKDGALTGKKFIGPAGGHIELTDSVFDVLDRIQAKSAVANADDTPVIKLGGCGKYHKELVDAGVGGPYILWESVNCG